MPAERSNLFPVDTRVVLDTLVEKVHDLVDERLEKEPPATILPTLDSKEQLVVATKYPAVDRRLRRAGYFTRVIEVEIFEPAQSVAEWIPEKLEERLEKHGNASDAIVSICTEIAKAEPIDKPDPDDENAWSWRIPGPGGHVRHYLSRRAIGDALTRDPEQGPVNDPAELKRPWIYGFFVAACEEALPPEAPADPEAEASPDSA
jgi:hypothetical protein